MTLCLNIEEIQNSYYELAVNYYGNSEILTLTVHSVPLITSFTLAEIATESIGAYSIGVASMAFNTLINIWIKLIITGNS